MKTINLITVDALDDLPAIEGRLLSLRRFEDVGLLLRAERSLPRAIPRQKYAQLSGR
jgi:hypothetical protein